MPFSQVQACKLKLYNSGQADVDNVTWAVGWQDAPWPMTATAGSGTGAEEKQNAPSPSPSLPLYFHAAHRARGPAERSSDVLLLNVSNATGHVVGTSITFSTDGSGIDSRVLVCDRMMIIYHLTQ
jgi:hypothetical protein